MNTRGSNRLLAFLVALAGCVIQAPTAQCSQPASPGAADTALQTLADDYLDQYLFPNNPTVATLSGIHRYDDRIEDFSRAAVQRNIKTLHRYERRLVAIDPRLLSQRLAGDRDMLLSNVRGNLLTLEVIRPWQKNPDTYSSGITNSAYVIMEREFAPVNVRLRLLIAREKLMPAALRAAHENLSNPARIFTQIALEQLPGDESFFEHDLPGAFAAADEPALKEEFVAVNAQVINALKDYQSWLQKEVLPRSNGEFRLGARTFSAKLLNDEMVDTPLDRLLEIGLADLQRNQTEFARLARQLEPSKTPQQVVELLAADHPPPERLLDSFRADFDGLIDFLAKHPIITLPPGPRPVLQETPPAQRATTFASMDSPGQFESVDQRAFFYVTLPGKDWDAKRTAGFMAQFNYPVISNVVVHEAYPGHYTQDLWMHRIEDRVRKVMSANTNVEGWAHYCEQMMLDEGYGQPGLGARDERQALLLRLGQLQDALLRNARYIVAIKLHTQNMTINQAIDYFVRQGYQSREVGETETKRGASDATYLYYTLGKLQILKLRSDLQAREGNRFRLQDFHDAFMQQGYAPIKLIRRALLQDDSPTL
jgi:uncharacterized protein (DUF885 family)